MKSSVDKTGAPLMTDLPFDRIVLGDKKHQLSIQQFLALPLDQRIALILERKLAFFRGDAPVNQAAALKSLMALARGGRDPVL
jgi:hypothetical protein